MFWKFDREPPRLDTLLEKEDVTLLEVLDEEDVLQECKTQSPKLIEFLVRSDNLTSLVDLAVTEPPNDGDERLQYKYANLACEVLSSDVDSITEKLVGDQDLLEKLWSFLDGTPPLNPLLASFFSKIITMMFAKKGHEIFEYMRSHDALEKLLMHIEISAIMEIFVKMVSIIDTRLDIVKVCEDYPFTILDSMTLGLYSVPVTSGQYMWLDEQNLVQKLVRLLHPSESPETHYNVAQLLSEFIRIGRESLQQGQDSEEDMLLLSIERRETVMLLLDTIFSEQSTNAESALVNGMLVLLSTVEYKKPSIEGIDELIPTIDTERIATGIYSALDALAPRLDDFHQVLVDPPLISTMQTTAGLLEPPLGKVRLNVAWLVSAVVGTNLERSNKRIAELGTLNVLLDLFFKYQWNNFLHTHIEHCISSILSSEPSFEDGETRNFLLTHLIGECSLMSKILKAWEENESQQSQPGGQRRGYMGHLTKIANNVVTNKSGGPNSSILVSLFSDLPDEEQTKWNEFVSGCLKDTNKRNTVDLEVATHPLHSSSDDDDDPKSGVFPHYEESLQQMFSNYQVQQMSNEFIEPFGYDEAEGQEQENSNNPFDEIGNTDFKINTNEDTPDASLFEAVCNEKIHQFDDSGSDDDDVWEEKELTYSSAEGSKQSSKGDHESDSDSESGSEHSSHGSTDSNDGDEERAVFDDDVQSGDLKEVVNNPLIGAQDKDKVEKMEIDHTGEGPEWDAQFDSSTVAMDTLDAASVGWVNTATDASSEVASGEGFADFTDISKFEDNSMKPPGDSPMAMDAEHITPPIVNSFASDIKMAETLAEEPKSVDGVKVELLDGGKEDPLLVQSQVLGSFVVIDTPSSPPHASAKTVGEVEQPSTVVCPPQSIPKASITVMSPGKAPDSPTTTHRVVSMVTITSTRQKNSPCSPDGASVIKSPTSSVESSPLETDLSSGLNGPTDIISIPAESVATVCDDSKVDPSE